MTTKIAQVKDSLKNGPLNYSEICKATGLAPAIVGVYLSTLQKRGEVTRVGNRGSFIYSRRGDSGGEKVSVPPAEQEGVWREEGNGAGLSPSAEETWPGASAAAEISEGGAS